MSKKAERKKPNCCRPEPAVVSALLDCVLRCLSHSYQSGLHHVLFRAGCTSKEPAFSETFCQSNKAGLSPVREEEINIIMENRRFCFMMHRALIFYLIWNPTLVSDN